MSMVLGSGGKRYVPEALLADAKKVFFAQEKKIADLEAWAARLEDEVLEMQEQINATTSGI
jgi:hypothetical protein